MFMKRREAAEHWHLAPWGVLSGRYLSTKFLPREVQQGLSEYEGSDKKKKKAEVRLTC